MSQAAYIERSPIQEPSRVKFSIHVDKNMNTAKDAAQDTEPHLLFENIPDLYNDDGELDDKYKYLLQLGKNRGAEGKRFHNQEWVRRDLPRYDEIDFFDRLPARGRDTSPGKVINRTNASQNRDLRHMYSELMDYGYLAECISVKNINYSFTPRQLRNSKPHLTSRRAQQTDFRHTGS